MRNLLKIMIAVNALTVAGSAFANWFDCVTPVIGVDYYQANMRLRHNHWNRFIPKGSYPGVTGYLGARFADCWGLELGYDGSATRSRRFNVTSDTSNNTIVGIDKVRRTGGHLDLMGYLPLDCCDCFELFGAVGYGYVRPKANFFISPDSTPNNTDFILRTTKRKNNSSVARLGLGANYMMTDCLGLRAKVGYESNLSLKLTVPENEFVGSSLKPFRSSVTWAAGTFLKF